MSVTCGHQGSILEPAQFNVFVKAGRMGQSELTVNLWMMPNVGVISMLEDRGTWADWGNDLIEMSLSSVKENAVLDLEWDNPMQQYKLGTD